ncbi:MAG: hypothetical protein IIB56_02745 [Planctomycetes bacterium]|nr:hypothetical protein [Planctomycetota bacterium]MCH8118505.1 hypothetical protein [Planctomycetota bacterium]
MKIVTTLLLTAVVLFGVAGIAQADSGPFVNISTTSGSLEFGTPALFSDGDTSFGPGSVIFPNIYFMSSAALTVKVESNYLHGPIVASITALKHPRGGSIPPERIFIKAPTTNGYVTMAKPVVISRPEIGSHDIELNFRLDIYPSDHAGSYTGTITFTIMPPPP